MFDPIARRLRCFGHVINLVVRAFMYGTDVDAFELDIASLHTCQKEVDELVAWRKRGALGKLHNVCAWICRTPQRRDEFAEYVKQNLGAGVNTLVPMVGNVTRWNSDFLAIKRAFILREPIEDFVANAIRRNRVGENRISDPTALRFDQLSLSEWDDLRDILEILEPFYTATLLLEGYCTHGSLSMIIPIMDNLLTHLETAKNSLYADRSHHLLTALNNSWDKLNTYYGLLDFAPVMCASIALHPGMKFQWFQDE